jgi:hypothetical protein
MPAYGPSGRDDRPVAKSGCRQEDRMRLRVASLAGLFLIAIAPAAGAEDDVRHVAFFGFQLINSSLEPTSEAETGRIAMLNGLFREKLEASGRFEIVALPPDVQQAVANGPEISGCNGCERGYATRSGADLAAWGTVQKVSNLILNINVYLTEAESGEMYFVRSVDIRGNTDESWRRGLDYLLRNYMLRQP